MNKFIFQLTCFASSLFLTSFTHALVIEIHDGIQSEQSVDDVDLSITPGFVSVINKEQFTNGSLQISDIIEKETAVQVRSTSGPGSLALASIRGKSSDQVSVYLDGVLINDPQSGGVDLSLFSTGNIDSIEIYKDTIPIQFPIASIGGVINIKTQRTNTTEKKLDLSYGSYATKNIKGLYKSRANKLGLIFSGEYIESANDYPFVNDKGTPHNKNDDFLSRRYNNQYNQTNFLAKLDNTLSSKNQLSAQIEGMQKKQGLPSIINARDASTSLDQEQYVAKIKWINTGQVYSGLSFIIDINSKYKTLLYDDLYAEVSLENEQTRYKSKSNEFNFLSKFERNYYQLMTSLSISDETFVVTEKAPDFYQTSNNRYSTNLGFQSHFFWRNKSLIVSPAIRYHRIFDSRQTNSDNPDFSFIYYTPQFGMKYILSNQLTLKSNASKYYRLPSFLELYGGRGYIGANGSLQPENGVNLDLGYEYNLYPRSSWLTEFKLQTAVYHSSIQNEIIFIPNGQDSSKPKNIGQSEVLGLENQLLLEMFYNFNVTLNTTIQKAVNKSNDKERALPGRTPFSQYIKLAYEQNKYKFYVEFNWDAGFYFDTMEQLYSEPKSLVNTGIKYFWKEINLAFDIKNLSNTQYKNYFFQPFAGRYMLTTLQFSF